MNQLSNDAVDPKPQQNVWLERGLFAALVLACAIAMSKNQADPDFWGHVQYGKDLLKEGLPATSTYTYTAEGYRWINHENLAEILFAIGVDTLGPAALLLLKCLLGIAVLSIIVRRAKQQAISQIALFVAAGLTAINLMHFWALRPQLFSFFYFALMLVILSRAFHGWQNRWHFGKSTSYESLDVHRADYRWLWFAPLLFVFWTNTHGGFLAGLAIFSAYLVLRSCELLFVYRAVALPTVLQFAGVVIASIAATLLNPYGIELHQWLIASLGVPRPEIVEWLPPEVFSIVFAPFWVLTAVLVASLVGSRKPRDLTHLVIITLTLWQSMEHRRHFAFLALLFGFWVPIHLDSFLRRFQIGVSDEPFGVNFSDRGKRLYAGGLATALVLMVFTLFSQLHQVPVRMDGYPVNAFQYMADHQLQGNLIVRFKWAQYAIAAFGNQGIKVGVDGRFRTCYPQEVLDMYFDFANGNDDPTKRYRGPQSPPPRDTAILEYKNPTLVLIDREQEHAVQVMQRQREQWTLLYQDQQAQLWGRSSLYDDPRSAIYLPPSRRVISNEEQRGVVAWPALPTGHRSMQLVNAR